MTELRFFRTFYDNKKNFRTMWNIAEQVGGLLTKSQAIQHFYASSLLWSL